MTFYSDMDYHNHNNETRKWFYNYIPAKEGYCGVGIAWDGKNKEPLFVIERVEDVLVEEGDTQSPPVYEPVGVETIIVKPKLRRFRK